jgi:hypothetical protein
MREEGGTGVPPVKVIREERSLMIILGLSGRG